MSSRQMDDAYRKAMHKAAQEEGHWLNTLSTLLASYPEGTVLKSGSAGLCQKLPKHDLSGLTGEHGWLSLTGHVYTDIELADDMGPYEFLLATFTPVDYREAQNA